MGYDNLIPTYLRDSSTIDEVLFILTPSCTLIDMIKDLTSASYVILLTYRQHGTDLLKIYHNVEYRETNVPTM